MAKHWLGFGAMAFAAALAAILFWPSSEPTYKGKALKYWLQAYELSVKVPIPSRGPSVALAGKRNLAVPNESEAEAAVTAIGTNAIPTLLSMIQHRKNPLKMRLFRLLQMIPILRITVESPINENWEALQAFTILGTNGASATAQLVEIYKRQPDGHRGDWVIPSLGAIGPPAKAATSILLEEVKGTNSVQRQNAIYALGKIHSDAPRVVPVLISALQDQQPSVGAAAIMALEYYGPDAKAAVPALLNLINATNRNAAPTAIIKVPSGVSAGVPTLGQCATNALLEIDLDAAMKAGIHPRW